MGHGGIGGEEGHPAGACRHHGQAQDVGVEIYTPFDITYFNYQMAQLLGCVSHNHTSCRKISWPVSVQADIMGIIAHRNYGV